MIIPSSVQSEGPRHSWGSDISQFLEEQVAVVCHEGSDMEDSLSLRQTLSERLEQILSSAGTLVPGSNCSKWSHTGVCRGVQQYIATLTKCRCMYVDEWYT